MYAFVLATIAINLEKDWNIRLRSYYIAANRSSLK